MTSIVKITNTKLPHGIGLGENLYIEIFSDSKKEYKKAKKKYLKDGMFIWIEDDAGMSGVFHRKMREDDNV